MNTLKRRFNEFLFFPNNHIEKILNWVLQIRPSRFWSVVPAYYIFGIVLNRYDPFPSFYGFQALFLVIGIVSFWSVRHYFNEMQRILDMDDLNHTEIFKDWEKIMKSRSVLILPLLATIFFITQITLLVDIPIATNSSIYMIITFVTCVVISFAGYFQFICLKKIIYRLSRSSHILKYNEEYPANTNWLVALAMLSATYRNRFFFLGSCYLIGAFCFLSQEAFGISQKVVLFPALNYIYFLFVFCAIFAIAVVFPVCCYLEYGWLKCIIDNLKETSVRTLQSGKTFLTYSPQISMLIISILNTPDYPFKDLWGKVISVLIGLINVAASVVGVLSYF